VLLTEWAVVVAAISPRTLAIERGLETVPTLETALGRAIDPAFRVDRAAAIDRARVI
jgi:hypothetical protein